MNEISDLDRYNERMTRSFIDKLFFLDKVDADIFLDFGCADGAFLELINRLFPDHKYIGYDIDYDMICKAKERGCEGIQFTDDFDHAMHLLDNSGQGKTCIILNSVIHEVYSYGPNQVDDFWFKIFNLDADYIAIRDMSVAKTASRPSDPISVARVRQLFKPHLIAQWEAQWGSLEENWSLVHFLLTYHYEDNWEREYKENYLPIPVEDLLAKFPREYFPNFIEHYTLPYIRNKVMFDFGIQLQERTHLKLIMEKHRV